MSTRANIIIKDNYNKLFFYRHHDGYPETTLKSLEGFMSYYGKKFRNSVMQSAGWLILWGAKEYETSFESDDWKVGAYEPTTGIHGDIEYLYVIDLNLNRIFVINGCFESYEEQINEILEKEAYEAEKAKEEKEKKETPVKTKRRKRTPWINEGNNWGAGK